MGNPCDFIIHGKKMKMDEFLSYIKSMPHKELNDVLGGIPSFKNIPEAPFVTDTNSWVRLGLKYALKHAVEQGTKRIAWTTGEQQNERYDLSKQVNSIKVEKVEEVPNLFFVDIATHDYENVELEVENGIIREGEFKGKPLEDVVGKEVAQKILEGGTQTLEGDNLKLGGKGMKGFYGEPSEGKLGIVGEVAKKLFKQEPKTTEILGKQSQAKGDEGISRVDADGKQWQIVRANDNKVTFKGTWDEVNAEMDRRLGFDKSTQHSIEITPELKAEVEGGLPLFKDNFKKVADAIRSGKIGNDIAMGTIPFVKEVWNKALDVAAAIVEKTGDIKKGIDAAIDYIKQTKWYKELSATDQKRAEDKFRQEHEHLLGDGEPPKDATKEPTVEDENKVSGITHADTNEIRTVLGMPEYKGAERTTHSELIDNAKKAIAENPNIANEVIDKYRSGGKMTAEDNAILAEYKASLDFQLENNPSKKIFDKITEILDVLEPSGSEAGKLLESRKLLSAKQDNLSNFLLDKQMSQGATLSEKQVVEETAKYKELKDAKDALEKQLIQEREQHAKEIAEIGYNKAKANARKASKKTKEEYKAERKEIISKAREALKDLRSGKKGLQSRVIPYQELKVIAPHVRDFLLNLSAEGIDKLDNAVSLAYAEFKDLVEGLLPRDILDIAAGEYDTKKELTRNEKAASLRLLQREAKLIKELEAARKDIEIAKSENKRVEKTRRIKELEEKIKEVKNANKNRDIDETIEDMSSSIGIGENEKELQRRLANKIKKLEYDIKNKKYLEEKEKPKPFKKSRKTILLQDKVSDLEEKIMYERSLDKYNKRSKSRKAFDKVMEVLGIRRIVQSAADMSIPFRQGATLISPRNFNIWAKGFKANLKSVFSPKNYSRIMYELRHDPDYHEMIKDGIVYNDLNSANPEAHNEDFKKSFVYKTPIAGEILKASNRSADAFLNVARYEIYKKLKINLENQGITRESDPEAYRFAANWAMNMTGRGNMIKALENSKAHVILGNTFYGARLMASRFNLLNPVTYFDPRTPLAVRKEAMKDMASWTVTVIASGLALSAAGGQVNLNPWDGDFLQVRFGNKVYDLSGGLANYIRTFLRIVSAGNSKLTGTKYEGRKDIQDAGWSVVRFFRNKLSPNTAYVTDAIFGKANGQEFDPSAAYQIYPMYVDDVTKAFKEEGIVSLATVLLPNILGVGYGNYASKGTIDDDIETLYERNMRSDETDKSKIFNYNEGGREITNKEFDMYISKRDAEIKAGIDDLYKNGLWVEDNGQIVQKPYKDLTKEQVVDETNKIKSKATKKAKEALFGVKPENVFDGVIDVLNNLPKTEK